MTKNSMSKTSYSHNIKKGIITFKIFPGFDIIRGIKAGENIYIYILPKKKLLFQCDSGLDKYKKGKQFTPEECRNYEVDIYVTMEEYKGILLDLFGIVFLMNETTVRCNQESLSLLPRRVFLSASLYEDLDTGCSWQEVDTCASGWAMK